MQIIFIICPMRNCIQLFRDVRFRINTKILNKYFLGITWTIYPWYYMDNISLVLHGQYQQFKILNPQTVVIDVDRLMKYHIE